MNELGPGFSKETKNIWAPTSSSRIMGLVWFDKLAVLLLLLLLLLSLLLLLLLPKET